MLINIFGASPVQPLEKHIDLGYRAVAELPGFFNAVGAGSTHYSPASSLPTTSTHGAPYIYVAVVA